MNGRHALVALAALVATSAVVFGLGPFAELQALAPDGKLLDMAPRAAAEAWLAELPPRGRELYAQFVWWDAVFLIVHGAAMFMLLRVGLRRALPRLVALQWLPVAAATFDATENALVLALLDGNRAGDMLFVVTSAKLALVPIVFAVVAGTWATVAVAAWRRGSHS